MGSNSAKRSPSEFHAEPLRPTHHSIDGGADSELSRCYTASTFRRFIAALIDFVILTVAFKVIGGKSTFEISLAIAFYFAWEVGNVALFGQTPGDRALGIYVVDDRKFSPPQRQFPSVSWIAAFIRAVTAPIPVYIAFLSVTALLSPKRKTFYEWASKTRTIQLRRRSSVPKKRIFCFGLFILLSIFPYAVGLYMLSTLPPGTLRAALAEGAAKLDAEKAR